VGGIKKVPVNNTELLEGLRRLEPGKWQKVYKDGLDGAAKKSVHYFESPSGQVFDVKVIEGWSNLL